MKIIFPSYSHNEGFARAVAACFGAALDPTVSELADIKAAVSEAVTNSIVHAYPDSIGDIEMQCRIKDGVLYIKIRDKGVGIEDVKTAMQPCFTTKPSEERAGLGFAVMESFTDTLKVTSKPGKGTTVIMTKRLVLRNAI